MDVSDGLCGDLQKLCKASAVGARLDLERLPVSAELAGRHAQAECERFVLFGGDDYELLFTVSADRAAGFDAGAFAGVPVHRIGVVEAGAGVRCERDGCVVDLRGGGYDHFA